MRQEELLKGKTYYYKQKLESGYYEGIVEITSNVKHQDTEEASFMCNAICIIQDEYLWGGDNIMLMIEDFKHEATKETHPEYYL